MKNTIYDLNGFSNWEKVEIQRKEYQNFALTFACTPYTYESCESCLFSAFHPEERSGITVNTGKQGKLSVLLGLGSQKIKVESRQVALVFQKRNLVTIDFWGTTGWCYLYINGELAGIRQFRRNSVLTICRGEMGIGKNLQLTKDWMNKRGMFHGVLEFLDMKEAYLEASEVRELHDAFRGETQPVDLYRNLDFSGDIYRPVYHLMPPGKWMNEPHAPFCFNGKYHIFYQANPHAPIWDNLCWGHLISEDMIGWRDAGIAMYPDMPGLDIDGIWSGSACVNAQGIPHLFYTAGNDEKLPNQSVALALPKDLKDITLTEWEKRGVILSQQEGQGFIGEFRDPFVWQSENTWYILVGSGDSKNGGGNALLYSSEDLKEFQYHGYLLDYCFEENREVGHVWELPVLLPVQDEQGKHVCDILMFCACQIEGEVVETFYFLGEFDTKEKKFKKYHEKARLFDLGYGTFTGPSGFVTKDGRAVVFTIAQGKRKPDEEFASGWAHNGGLPVQLSMKNGTLMSEPVQELYAYFTEPVKTISKEIIGRNLQEHFISLSTRGEWISLLIEGENDCWEIRYDRKTREWKVISTMHGKQISKFRGEVDTVDTGEEPIMLECFVDHSMIELYLNRKKSMSLRNYAFCEKNEYRVKADTETEVLLRRFHKKFQA